MKDDVSQAKMSDGAIGLKARSIVSGTRRNELPKRSEINKNRD